MIKHAWTGTRRYCFAEPWKVRGTLLGVKIQLVVGVRSMRVEMLLLSLFAGPAARARALSMIHPGILGSHASSTRPDLQGIGGKRKIRRARHILVGTLRCARTQVADVVSKNRRGATI